MLFGGKRLYVNGSREFYILKHATIIIQYEGRLSWMQEIVLVFLYCGGENVLVAEYTL